MTVHVGETDATSVVLEGTLDHNGWMQTWGGDDEFVVSGEVEIKGKGGWRGGTSAFPQPLGFRGINPADQPAVVAGERDALVIGPDQVLFQPVFDVQELQVENHGLLIDTSISFPMPAQDDPTYNALYRATTFTNRGTIIAGIDNAGTRKPFGGGRLIIAPE